MVIIWHSNWVRLGCGGSNAMKNVENPFLLISIVWLLGQHKQNWTLHTHNKCVLFEYSILEIRWKWTNPVLNGIYRELRLLVEEGVWSNYAVTEGYGLDYDDSSDDWFLISYIYVYKIFYIHCCVLQSWVLRFFTLTFPFVIALSFGESWKWARQHDGVCLAGGDMGTKFGY